MTRTVMGFYFTLRLLQMVVPWVVGVINGVLRLMWLALSSLWVGVPQATKNIADDLMNRAVAIGFPTIWDENIYYALRIVAFLTIVLGWILLSFFTVWIVKIIF